MLSQVLILSVFFGSWFSLAAADSVAAAGAAAAAAALATAAAVLLEAAAVVALEAVDAAAGVAGCHCCFPDVVELCWMILLVLFPAALSSLVYHPVPL